VFGVIGLSAACLVISATPSLAYQSAPPPTAQTFSQCPVSGAIGAKKADKVSTCIVGNAAQGSIDIAGLDTTFKGPGLVQFGWAGNSGETVDNTVSALDDQSYTAPPQLLSKPVMVLLGNPSGVTPPANSDVYVETILAGPISFNLSTPGSSGINPETIIPLIFKFKNPLLGPNCTLGTLADPVTLSLTTGTSGALTGTLGTLTFYDGGSAAQTLGTEVVDNVFSVPGATGCGNDGVWDNAIDSTNDLPSASGANQAILYGSFDLAAATWVKKNGG
jgi:hypothetical protein